MPLTLAHPAAAVPFRRVLGKYANLSGLVAGSLAPDFAYFLPFGVTRSESHSLVGLVWFSIPAGFAAWWLFHALLKCPLIFLAPDAAQCRLVVFANTRQSSKAEHLASVIISIAVGALTHVMWDAFTHARGPVVEFFAPLSTSIFNVGGHDVRVYKVLQHLSTALGITLLSFWSWDWLSRAPKSASRICFPRVGEKKGLIWTMVVLVSGMVGFARGFAALPHKLSLQAIRVVAGHALVSSLSAFALTLIALGLLWRVLESQTTDP